MSRFNPLEGTPWDDQENEKGQEGSVPPIETVPMHLQQEAYSRLKNHMKWIEGWTRRYQSVHSEQDQVELRREAYEYVEDGGIGWCWAVLDYNANRLLKVLHEYAVVPQHIIKNEHGDIAFDPPELDLHQMQACAGMLEALIEVKQEYFEK